MEVIVARREAQIKMLLWKRIVAVDFHIRCLICIGNSTSGPQEEVVTLRTGSWLALIELKERSRTMLSRFLNRGKRHESTTTKTTSAKSLNQRRSHLMYNMYVQLTGIAEGRYLFGIPSSWMWLSPYGYSEPSTIRNSIKLLLVFTKRPSKDPPERILLQATRISKLL